MDRYLHDSNQYCSLLSVWLSIRGACSCCQRLGGKNDLFLSLFVT
jgi:hypothetical protein